MERIEGMRVFFFFSELGISNYSGIYRCHFKITGAKVAYTRPRTFQIFRASWYFLDLRNSFFFTAYGEFKDETIAVANKRNQQLVNWDFEDATSLLWTVFKNLRFVSECSSGDSTGVKPEDQKALYDKVIKKRPSTILSLEHEVYGMFI